jgi:hypothetical protein
MLTRRRDATCQVCGKTLQGSRSALERHMRVHTGEQPFACATCLRRFTQKVALKGHQLLHTGEVPFACGTCQKAFRYTCNLRRHESKMHESRVAVIRLGASTTVVALPGHGFMAAAATAAPYSRSTTPVPCPSLPVVPPNQLCADTTHLDVNVDVETAALDDGAVAASPFVLDAAWVDFAFGSAFVEPDWDIPATRPLDLSAFASDAP